MTPSNANTRLRPNSYRSRDQAVSPNLSLSLGQGQGQAGGLYQCSRCDRCYNRTEHLARHVRSHTKQRPYSCSFCTKAFARMDILKRHQATHSRPQHELDSLQQSGQDYRVSRACRLCAATKSKCSDHKPCRRCVDKSLECTYPDGDGDGLEPVAMETDKNMEIDMEMESPEPVAIEEPYPSRAKTPDGSSYHPNDLRGDSTTICDIQCPEPPGDQPAASFTPQTQRDRGATLVDSGLHDQSTSLYDFLGPVGFPDLLDFSLLPDWDMTGLDLFTPLDTESPHFIPGGSLQTCPDASNTIASPHEALSVSGSWEPQPSENGEMEHPHLAAGDEDFRAIDLGHDPGASPLEMGLSTTGRDIVLNMILSTTSRANSTLILTAFPCTETLNRLIHIYVRNEGTTYINDILHFPTLDLNRQRPELLGAMISMGAINAGTNMIRKFGYAMQEVVRASSFRSWEENNMHFLDISLAQGFFIQQYIAFFSGIRRKVALAESCSNCVQAMIKSGLHLRGALTHTSYAYHNLAELDEPSLTAAWRQWALHESQRRLCYAAYIMDAHVSLSHGIKAITPHTHMNLPLPAPRRLWAAKTPTEWKEEMLNIDTLPKPQQPLCLRDALADPAILITHCKLLSTDFVTSSFLAGMWTLIKESHQLDLIVRGASIWNSLLVSSQRAELLSVLDFFGTQILGEGARPEMRLLYEAISMHTMVTSDDLVLPKLTSLPLDNKIIIPPTTLNGLKLSTSVEYRTTLWLAGRMISTAAECPYEMLSGVHVIVLFHAAVLLWWHGIKLLRENGHPADLKMPKAGVCVLNGYDSHKQQALSGQYDLALRGESHDSPPILLTNVSGVMESIKKIVMQNWRRRRMPITVQEICRALQNLGTAAQNFQLEFWPTPLTGP